jgi:SAM-dependent methyltransferase
LPVSADPQGRAFDSAAEDYERGRTGWPPEVLDGLGGEGALDLAAGTGKLTRLLVDRFAHVVAVEPSDAMRAVGRRVVPQAEWLAGTAEEIPLPDGSFDAVSVGEAYHWFDAMRAAAEIARVLRPGGTVLIVFNDWEGSYEPALPAKALAAIEEVAERTGPGGRAKIDAGGWRAGLAEAPFTPLEYREVWHVDVTDREGIIAYFLSVSPIAARPQDERDALRHTLERLVPEAEYRLRLRAEIWSARRV